MDFWRHFGAEAFPFCPFQKSFLQDLSTNRGRVRNVLEGAEDLSPARFVELVEDQLLRWSSLVYNLQRYRATYRISGVPLFLWYVPTTHGSGAADGRTHGSTSLAFETVMLGHLVAALLYNLACEELRRGGEDDARQRAEACLVKAFRVLRDVCLRSLKRWVTRVTAHCAPEDLGAHCTEETCTSLMYLCLLRLHLLRGAPLGVAALDEPPLQALQSFRRTAEGGKLVGAPSLPLHAQVTEVVTLVSYEGENERQARDRARSHTWWACRAAASLRRQLEESQQLEWSGLAGVFEHLAFSHLCLQVLRHLELLAPGEHTSLLEQCVPSAGASYEEELRVRATVSAYALCRIQQACGLPQEDASWFSSSLVHLKNVVTRTPEQQVAEFRLAPYRTALRKLRDAAVADLEALEPGTQPFLRARDLEEGGGGEETKEKEKKKKQHVPMESKWSRLERSFPWGLLPLDGGGLCAVELDYGLSKALNERYDVALQKAIIQ